MEGLLTHLPSSLTYAGHGRITRGMTHPSPNAGSSCLLSLLGLWSLSKCRSDTVFRLLSAAGLSDMIRPYLSGF